MKLLMRQKEHHSRNIKHFVKGNQFLEKMSGLFGDGRFADVIFVIANEENADVVHSDKIHKEKHGDIKDGSACMTRDTSSKDEELCTEFGTTQQALC